MAALFLANLSAVGFDHLYSPAYGCVDSNRRRSGKERRGPRTELRNGPSSAATARHYHCIGWSRAGSPWHRNLVFRRCRLERNLGRLSRIPWSSEPIGWFIREQQPHPRVHSRVGPWHGTEFVHRRGRLHDRRGNVAGGAESSVDGSSESPRWQRWNSLPSHGKTRRRLTSNH